MLKCSEPTPERPVPVETAILGATSFGQAVEMAKPTMTNTAGDISPGATLFASYALEHAQWSDFNGSSETTIGKILVDAQTERGKRICVTGTLDAIEGRDVGHLQEYVGRLHVAEYSDIAFVALGVPADLRAHVLFCGVVIGTAGPAVSAVGMFYLPENQQPIVERPVITRP